MKPPDRMLTVICVWDADQDPADLALSSPWLKASMALCGYYTKYRIVAIERG